MRNNIQKICAILIFSVVLLGFFNENSQAQCPVKAFASSYKINCGDSVSLSAQISAVKTFEINFDAGADSRLTTSSGTVYNNPCNNSKNGTSYLWFGGGLCPRSATTIALDLSKGGNFCFSMRYAAQGGSAPCEGVDAPDEGVYFQYSIDNGSNWTTINYYDPKGGNDAVLTAWNEYCFSVPAAAMTTNTMIRWIQLNASIPVQTDYDHWGLEDIYFVENKPATYFKWEHTGIKKLTAETPKVAPHQNTTYKVKYYDGNDSCEASVDIEVKLPTISVTKDRDNICPGTPVKLLAYSSFVRDLPTVCSVNNTGPGCDEFSQSKEFNIGTGSSVDNFNSISPKTFGDFGSDGNRTQIIFLASELKAQGFKGGQLSYIGFDIANIRNNGGNFTSFNCPNFSISLLCTNVSAFTTSSAYASGAVRVYSRTSQPIKLGINYFYFDQTYNWDGVSNIIIDVCFYYNNFGDGDIYAFTKNTATTFNSIMNNGSGSEGSCATSPNPNYVDNNRPNVYFGTCVPIATELEYSWTPATGLDNPSVQNPTATPDETITYTVAVNEKGNPECKSYKSITINLVNPKITVSPSDTTICAGQSVNIKAKATTSGLAIVPKTFTYTNPNTTDTIKSKPASSAGTFAGVGFPLTVSGMSPAALSPTSIVSVCINLKHPKMSEITMTLRSPGGTTQNLVAKRGGNGANFTGCLTDFAGTAVSAGAAPFSGTYRAEVALANFAGNINGTWTLTVIDDATEVAQTTIPPSVKIFTGHLNSWDITLNNQVPNYIKTSTWTPATGLDRTDVPDVVATPSSTQTYKITMVDGNNCVASKSMTIHVGTSNDVPAISSNSPICEGDTLKLFTTDNTAAIYDWTGPNGFHSDLSNPVIPNASLDAIGDYHLQVTSVSGCISGIATLSASINPKDDATFDYGSSTVCQTGSNPIPTKAIGVAGTFSSSPIGLTFVSSSTGEIDLAHSAVGSYTIKYETNGTCPASATSNITISGSPDASFTYPNASYCKSENNPTPQFPVGASAGIFEVIESGLQFVSTATGVIDLKNSNAGTYQVINKIASSGSCAESRDTTVITIKNLPDPSFTSSKTSFCVSDAKVLLSPTVSGGIFSGNGLVGNEFDPATAGVGKHIIKYIVNDNSCTDSSSQEFTVNSLPDPAFSGLNANYCSSDPLVELIPSTAGGVFSGPGISDHYFNPGILSAGTYTIKYIVTNASGCSDSSSFNVTITNAPNPSFSGLMETYCNTDPASTLTPVSTGGTFYGNGINGNLFDPSTAGEGTFYIKYVVGNANNCVDSSQQAVTVYKKPNAAFSGLSSEYCVSDASVKLAPVQEGGIFSGVGVVNNDTFDPTLAGPGTYTIKYIIDNNGYCTDSSTFTVTVNALPNPKFTGLDQEYCVSDGNVTLNPAESGGTFSGTGVSGNIFSPSAAGAGTHKVKYVITNDKGCTDSSIFTVRVNTLPNASFTGLNAEYCDGDETATLTPVTSGGTFKGVGISGNSFDPSTAGVGTHIITYVVKNSKGCTDSTKKTVKINGLPEANVGKSSSICYGQSIQIGAEPVSGNIYSWVPATGLSNPSIANPMASPTKTTKYTLTVTSAAGCIANDDVTITVNPLPKADFGFSITDKTFTAIGTAENGVYAWEWDFGDRSKLDSTRNPVHTYLQCDFFIVTLKVTSQCGKDSISKEIKTCSDTTVVLGLDQVNSSFKNSFKVFPNPVSDKLELAFTLPKNGLTHIQMYNSIGELISIPEFMELSAKELKAGEHHYTINLGAKSLASGLYMIVTEYEGQNYNHTITVNKTR